jgi:hypothetical protein
MDQQIMTKIYTNEWIFIDTWAFIALLVVSDLNHSKAQEIWNNIISFKSNMFLLLISISPLWILTFYKNNIKTMFKSNIYMLQYNIYMLLCLTKCKVNKVQIKNNEK